MRSLLPVLLCAIVRLQATIGAVLPSVQSECLKLSTGLNKTKYEASRTSQSLAQANVHSTHPDSFPVPITDLMVVLSLPKSRTRLPEVGIIHCLTSFIKVLSKENPNSNLLTTRYQRTPYVDASITPLSDVSQSSTLTVINAIRVLSALSEFLVFFRLFEAMQFGVLDSRRRNVAFGTLSYELGLMAGFNESATNITENIPTATPLRIGDGLVQPAGSLTS